MRILVTGAQGFLGGHIVDQLFKSNITVLATGRREAENTLVCNLSNAKEVQNLINVTAPDRIIHCAANVPKNLNEYSDEKSAKENLDMLDLVLEASSCPIILVSSMTVYGEGVLQAVSENQAGSATTA